MSAREQAEALLKVIDLGEVTWAESLQLEVLAGIGWAVLALADAAQAPITDADLGPLLNAVNIHTDDDGRHFDDQGREHEAVDVDGEVTYRLIGGGQ